MSSIRRCLPALRRSARDWRRLLAEWHRSEMTTRAFCESRRLSLKTFQWRRWALTRRGGLGDNTPGALPARDARRSARVPIRRLEASAPAFIEVVTAEAPKVVVSAGRLGGVEVIVTGRRGERRIRVDVGFDLGTFRQVLSALEEA